MKGPVRAKFRCLRIAQVWNGGWEIELSPVMQRGDNSEENKRFWEASPSGECSLFYHREHPFEVGAYYYIDMVPKDGGDWSLGSVTKQGGGSGEVALSCYKTYDYRQPKPVGLLRGEFKVGIDGSKTEALACFGEPADGHDWDVQFKFAEPSDDEE